jgi:N-acetyl-1-D-myo-inositol-2-amino-2-deoxy-alpha-D-glucopyranoside deacetylase
VVVTFEPHGGYGHPDHIAAHRHAAAAFHAASEPQSYTWHGPIWRAQRLFYTVIPRSFFERMRARMISLGIDEEELGNFDREDAGWPDDQVNVTIDVSGTVDEKWEALNCHRTQFGPGNLFNRLSDQTAKALMSREHFALAWPEPDPGLTLDDLFDGL